MVAQPRGDTGSSRRSIRSAGGRASVLSAYPRDPVVGELVRLAERSALTRRRALALGAAGLSTLLLAACSTGAAPRPTAARDTSSRDRTVRWANWPDYLDADGTGAHPTLVAFAKATGITPTYEVAIEDNSTYYAKVRAKLSAGEDIGADAVCLTDWMVGRLIRQGWTQQLDASRMPNLANLQSDLREVDYDAGRKYSVPWQGGFAGLAWNREQVPNGLQSVDQLWDASLKGRVGVLSELRDTIGLIMLQDGVDVSGPFTEAQFGTALDRFREQIRAQQIRSVKGNSYTDDLVDGTTLAAIAWSGDIATINAEHGDKWGFAIPDAGGTRWYDNFIVPIGSAHRANVEQLIDWYYQPEIAAQVATYVNYITPVTGAKEIVAQTDPELAADTLIFPDEQTLARTKVFRTLTAAEEQRFSAQFQGVLLGA